MNADSTVVNADQGSIILIRKNQVIHIIQFTYNNMGNMHNYLLFCITKSINNIVQLREYTQGKKITH